MSYSFLVSVCVKDYWKLTKCHSNYPVVLTLGKLTPYIDYFSKIVYMQKQKKQCIRSKGLQLAHTNAGPCSCVCTLAKDFFARLSWPYKIYS